MTRLALIIAGASLVAFLAAIGLGPAKEDLRFDQAHHLYWGAPLVIVGAWRHGVLALVLLWLGVVLMLDDAIEHCVQRLTGDLHWASPLHRLYGLIYDRWPWLRALNAWVDRRLR